MTSQFTIGRRDMLRASLLGSAAALLPSSARAATPRPPQTPIRWIDDDAPPLSLGQTFGVPWPRGAVKAGAPLSLRGDGKPCLLYTSPSPRDS